MTDEDRFIYICDPLWQKGNKVSVWPSRVIDTDRKCNLTRFQTVCNAKVKFWPIKAEGPFWENGAERIYCFSQSCPFVIWIVLNSPRAQNGLWSERIWNACPTLWEHQKQIDKTTPRWCFPPQLSRDLPSDFVLLLPELVTNSLRYC